MRTTVRLEDALMREAKVRAAEEGITLTQLIAEALRDRLAGMRGEAGTRAAVELASYGKGGLRPGVDLSDNRAVRDLMDEDLA
ncbi:MAG TPA: CopG family transcriptional regulator [Solirubrobacterales bacterium]|nr:CopG family transcriptional regulator [Solirubrobacterales bacterium]